MTTEQQLKVIELRDVQPILSQTFGNGLTVIRCTTKNLLPPGENYGSTILNVHAVIKRDDDTEEEDLYLVAKMPPPTEFQRKLFDSPYSFKKEIFMYESILPHYNQLEREAGLKEEELFDILPKYYKSRLSLCPTIDFDDDAVILMENLSARDYYINDRTKGCDLEHSKVVIRAMARFHALGMAIKYKKPEYFEELKNRSECLKVNTDDFDHVHVEIQKKIEEDPEMAIYADRCKMILNDSYNMKAALWTAVPDEPWSTIIHADFWVNNIMFHRDETGGIDDVKFVDFQNYLFFSPLREMIFFLFSSTLDETRDNHIDELIDLYYETFLIVLSKMGCDTKLFTRESFDAKLPIDAKFEFLHLCFMLKVVTLNTQEINYDNFDKIENVIISYQGNQAFIERLRKVVLYFANRKWI